MHIKIYDGYAIVTKNVIFIQSQFMPRSSITSLNTVTFVFGGLYTTPILKLFPDEE